MAELSKYKLLAPASAGQSENLLASKTAEKGQRRTQALRADWLRMENVVVLTAPGCSVGAGGRLMAGSAETNLECLVLDAVVDCPLSPEAKAVIAWKKKNDFGKGHFEDWLGYLFNASGLTALDHSPIAKVTWKGQVAGADVERYAANC